MKEKRCRLYPRDLYVIELECKAPHFKGAFGDDAVVLSTGGQIRDAQVLGGRLAFKEHSKVEEFAEAFAKFLEHAPANYYHVYIATEDDAEGEVIGWSVLEVMRSRGFEIPMEKYLRMRFSSLAEMDLRIARSQAKPGLDAGRVRTSITRAVLDGQIRLVNKRCVGVSLSWVQAGLFELIERMVDERKRARRALRLRVKREDELHEEEYSAYEIMGDLGLEEFGRREETRESPKLGENRLLRLTPLTTWWREEQMPIFSTAEVMATAMEELGMTPQEIEAALETLYRSKTGGIQIPLAPREAAKHLPDEGSRKLFLLLHDLLEAVCAGAPVWKLERRLVWVGNVHFALETASLVEKGWRGGRFGDRSIGRVTGSEALPPDTVYRAIAIEEAELPPHPPLTLSDVLREMAKVGLGRPSTYVDALKDLVKYRNFDEDEGCLSGDAKVLLERLRKNPETRAYLLEFSQRMRSCLEEIAEGRRTSRDVLQALLPTLHGKVGEDIDALQIDDTPATPTDLKRDQASLGQEAIFWRGAGLAKEIDPEVQIGGDSPSMHEYPSDKTRRLAGLLAGNVFSTKMELDRMIARAPEAMKMGHEVAIGSLLQWQIVLNRYDTATRPVYDAVMARSTFKDGPRLRRQIVSVRATHPLSR